MTAHDRRRLLDLVERAEWKLQARPTDVGIVPMVPGWALAHAEADGRHLYTLLVPDGRVLRGTPGVVLRQLLRTGWVRAARAILDASADARGAA